MKNDMIMSTRVCLAGSGRDLLFVLGVDREGVRGYDGYVHLFHKREFNEKMEREIREI